MLQQLEAAIEDNASGLGRGEKNRLERFCTWLECSDETGPDRRVFISYGIEIGSRGVLSDLEKSMSKLFLPDHDFRIELRAAVKDHRHRVDGEPMLLDLFAAPYWKPFLPYRQLDHIPRVEIMRLDSWLAWLYERHIENPKVEHYHAFSEENGSSEAPLVSLQRTFKKLDLPKIYAIEVELPKAITLKRSQRWAKNRKPRIRPMTDRLAVIPESWKTVLEHLHMGCSPTGARCPAPGFMRTIENSLYALARFCVEHGIDPSLKKECLVLFARDMKRRRLRAQTREINLSAIVRFRRHMRLDFEDQDSIQNLFNDIERDGQTEIPRIDQKLARVGTIEHSLTKAIQLLQKSRDQCSLTLRISYLCSATALAMFSLIPLRVKDTNLIWGEHIFFSGERYHLDLATSKTGEPFKAPLCDFLTPFIDALLLCGCDDAYLPHARDEAMRNTRPLFMKANSEPISDSRVANIWFRHIGCKPHVARARIHTELGKLGAEGVEIALALCAQRDPETAKYYQGRAMRDALIIQSYDALTSDLTHEELAAYFPDLDRQM